MFSYLRPGDIQNNSHPGGAPETKLYFLLALPYLFQNSGVVREELLCRSSETCSFHGPCAPHKENISPPPPQIPTPASQVHDRATGGGFRGARKAKLVDAIQKVT